MMDMYVLTDNHLRTLIYPPNCSVCSGFMDSVDGERVGESVAYGGARLTHQFINVRKEGIVTSILVVVLVFTN